MRRGCEARVRGNGHHKARRSGLLLWSMVSTMSEQDGKMAGWKAPRVSQAGTEQAGRASGEQGKRAGLRMGQAAASMWVVVLAKVRKGFVTVWMAAAWAMRQAHRWLQARAKSVAWRLRRQWRVAWVRRL